MQNIRYAERYFKETVKRYLTVIIILMGILIFSNAHAANLSGLGVTGINADGTETAVPAYRWLVEEDLTYHSDGTPDANTLAVSFHRSYMPVAAKGCMGYGDIIGPNFPCDDVLPGEPTLGGFKADTHYYVSVLPRSGYSIGGASFKTDGAGNPGTVNVTVNAEPIPTAQISILIFEDNFPINNAPDLPAEDPGSDPSKDMSGFQITVEDAGGRYGVSAGMMMLNVFGDPLGTTYDAAGNVTGLKPLITGPDGRLTIKNLAPGKYGIQAVPPAGKGWQQTSTIEGTKIIDAWVKANEPPYFAEFGPPGFHVFIGFVKEFSDPAVIGQGGTPITGKVVNLHMSRPPDYAFYNGSCFGHTTPWVGLNDLSVGIGKGIYAAPTNENCEFSIPNVPDGNYQLVIWDNNLDLIFAFKGVSIAGGQCSGGSCDLGEVPVFQWFARQEHYVFNDINGDGFWDDGEDPINDMAVILRWRDGTVYQNNVTDMMGAYAFDQVFPFFAWLVNEVDFGRLQATGVTVTVDNGGPIHPPDPWSYDGLMNPQDQTNPLNPAAPVGSETDKYRVETGPVLTQAFQGFMGQTSAFLWGKRHYPDISPGLAANGGISGIVFYAVTRAENDPEGAAAEPWEPGIPGVEVRLYDAGVDGLFNTADDVLLETTTTDSWDDSIPEGCKYGNGAAGPFVFDPDGTGVIPPTPTDCYDGLRVFNQIRPGVFDGGYAFGPEFDCPGEVCPDYVDQDENNLTVGYLKPGEYMVEVIPPAGYEILKPEDKNVDFGDEFGPPQPELLPPPCIGADALIPPYLTLFPDEKIESPFAWSTGAYVPTYRPLCDRKKVTVSAGFNAAADFFLFTEVPIAAHGYGFILDDTQNEFDPNSPQFGEKFAPPWLPISIRDWTGREIGRTLSDQYGVYNFLAPSTYTTNIGSPSGMSPNMLTTCMNDRTLPDGSIDSNHNPIYSQFCYNFQYMPGVTTYLDTPVVPVGAFAGADQFPVDCELTDGTPRVASISDTSNGVGGGPYIPAATGAETLEIQSLGDAVMVPNPTYCNPVSVAACPAGSDTLNKFVPRDYGFGDSPIVMLIGEDGVEHELTGITGNSIGITGTVPPLSDGTYQMVITRTENGRSSLTGITVQIGLRGGASAIPVYPSTNPLATPIQDAIDIAKSNDLILVHPGQYNEIVIMWKPVQLQGFGEGSTVINAVKAPTEKLQIWRDKVQSLIQNGNVTLLPGQETGFGGIEPAALFTEEGAGILVLTANSGGNSFHQNNNQGARIDGFTITGADTGGGIVVNGNADYLEISNNRIAGNQGFFGGGIRVGHPELIAEQGDGTVFYTDAHNDREKIHHNQVVQNGSLDGAGGGISMCTGADSYEVTDNFVCGNFSLSHGGGIGHIGISGQAEASGPIPIGPVPLIKDNVVIFNEIFNQGLTVSGGGLFIGGQAPLPLGPAVGQCTIPPAELTCTRNNDCNQNNGGLGGQCNTEDNLCEIQPDNVCLADADCAGAGNVCIITPVPSLGSGSVQVISNLIQGNSAGAGNGGGVNLSMVNGQDAASTPYTVEMFNNMIVNNVAGLAGGGVSLQDAIDVRIIHNTITNNDSLGTAGTAFPPNSPSQSTPQPGAGIVSHAHSAALANITGPGFSDPQIEDTIVWHNRKFFFLLGSGDAASPTGPGIFGLCPDIGGSVAGLICPGGNNPVYDDLALFGTACDSASCITDPLADPLFIQSYINGARTGVLQPELTTAIQVPPAFDEGGNFIQPRFGPLSINVDLDTTGTAGDQVSDYHIQAGSPAVDAGVNLTGTYPAVGLDIDGDTRPSGATVDIGADER